MAITTFSVSCEIMPFVKCAFIRPEGEWYMEGELLELLNIEKSKTTKCTKCTNFTMCNWRIFLVS